MGIFLTQISTPMTKYLNMNRVNSAAGLQLVETLMMMAADKVLTVTPVSSPVTKRVSKTIWFTKHEAITGSPLIYITGEPTCHDSYNYIKLNGVNIRIGRNPAGDKHWAKSYTDARDDCEKNRGFLAKISNAEELSAMKMLNGVWIIILFISLSF